MPSMTGGTIGTSPLGSRAFADVASDAKNPTFLTRVASAMATVAREVQAEAGTVTNDTNRKNLAKSVLQFQGNNQLVSAFAVAILADLTTVTTLSDQTLLTRTEQEWDGIAGVI
jgi:hypothetical protein